MDALMMPYCASISLVGIPDVATGPKLHGPNTSVGPPPLGGGRSIFPIGWGYTLGWGDIKVLDKARTEAYKTMSQQTSQSSNTLVTSSSRFEPPLTAALNNYTCIYTHIFTFSDQHNIVCEGMTCQ